MASWLDVLGIVTADTLQCPHHVALPGVIGEGGHRGTSSDRFMHIKWMFEGVLTSIFHSILGLVFFLLRKRNYCMVPRYSHK